MCRKLGCGCIWKYLIYFGPMMSSYIPSQRTVGNDIMLIQKCIILTFMSAVVCSMARLRAIAAKIISLVLSMLRIEITA